MTLNKLAPHNQLSYCLISHTMHALTPGLLSSLSFISSFDIGQYNISLNHMTLAPHNVDFIEHTPALTPGLLSSLSFISSFDYQIITTSYFITQQRSTIISYNTLISVLLYHVDTLSLSLSLQIN